MLNNTKEIKQFIQVLGFRAEENKKDIYLKTYPNHNNYSIRIEFESEKIDYGNKIKLVNRTTCNFSAPENFVVLECVNRLLEKGYKPKGITLERTFPLGHGSGRLDISLDKDEKTYLMIECKTWGDEYEKARKKTLNDGGQILSYFQQDTAAKYLCLYASKLEDGTIKYKNSIIKVEPEFKEATKAEEVFEKWNKNFKDNGIFEPSSTPYDIAIKALTKIRLIPLTKDDSSRVFNQFAEILRHNVVSDKPNAFNKLITLLLCKIVDEDRGDTEELHFQWLETDTNIALQKRLNDLYKIGMDKYLTKKVTDYSDSDVDGIVGLDSKQKDIIKHMMTELRLKKNNEFAFKEVFNDSSFEENSRVLREVVELLQPYQVRYNKKHQFLGDFFELLLSTSIKQEAGQFFTPVPIARFIISSIPFKELILDKIEKKDADFLPYVIDYAVGSGHFLTEVMDAIHTILVELNDENNYKPSIKKNLSRWTEDYDWAYDFIYGIEKDYRLVKTAKVSCFLNGDGLARIFNADGLANFETATDYQDKLKEISANEPKDNLQFDTLIANPPYSVSAFKNTLIDGDKSFDLYSKLTDDSSEIECLFIERAKQLLKEGGYAGIILPGSILSNPGIYSSAREIILKYFKVVAITEFGSNTFMATGTNTVALFLEKRSNNHWKKIEHGVNTFFTNMQDVTCNGVEYAFSKYVKHVFGTIEFIDYISFIQNQPTPKLLQNEIIVEYRKAFDKSTFLKNIKKKATFKNIDDLAQDKEISRLFWEGVKKAEKEKLLYFILTYPQKTLIVKANPDGENETEKAFLGYEFSNRRGHEGIKPYGAKTIQQATKLYDETDLSSPERVNSYIHDSFLGKGIVIDKSLNNHIWQQNLIDIMQWDRIDFQKSISLSLKKKVILESKWPIVKLEEIIELISGQSPPSEFYNSKQKGLPFYQGKIDFGEDYLNPPTTWTENITKTSIKNDILMSVRAPVGPVNMNPYDEICIGRGLSALRITNPDCLAQYLYTYLKSNQKSISGNKGLGFDSISRDQIFNIKIPLPPKNIQETIARDIAAIETKQQNIESKIKALHTLADEHFTNAISKTAKVKFNFYATLEYGSSLPERDREKGTYPVMGSNGIVGYHNAFLIKSPCIIVGRKGSAGKVTLIEQDCFPIDTTFYVKYDSSAVNYKFVYYLLQSLKLESLAQKMGVPGLNRNEVSNEQVPKLSISEQNKVVANIEKVEKEIRSLKNELISLDDKKDGILSKYL